MARPLAADSISASGKTMAGSFPPLNRDLALQISSTLGWTIYNSRVVRFRCLAAAAWTFFPVAEDPVNVIFGIPG